MALMNEQIIDAAVETAKNVCEGSTKYSALQSLLLGESVEQEDIPLLREFKCVQEFLDLPMNDPKEGELKKLFAGAVTVAAESGVLPFDLPNNTAEGIASVVDEGLNRVKTAFKVATGEISIEEAADAMIDRAAARAVALVDFALDNDVAGNAIANVATAIYPPAEALRPIIVATVQHTAPIIKTVVHTVVPKIATAAKTVVRTAISTVKEYGKTLIKKGISALLSF